MTHGFEVILMALTIWGEARGEPYEGKLGVAWVLRNRAKRWKFKMSRVVLKAWQFSFWNTDDPSRDDISDIDPDSPIWLECLKAASAAYFELGEDPTKGAIYYLNPLSLKSLPSWWDTDGDHMSEVAIGRHRFRRPRGST